MNAASVVLLILIGILFFLAIRHMVRNGGVCSCGTVGSSCSGNCKNCACADCGKQKAPKDEEN